MRVWACLLFAVAATGCGDDTVGDGSDGSTTGPTSTTGGVTPPGPTSSASTGEPTDNMSGTSTGVADDTAGTAESGTSRGSGSSGGGSSSDDGGSSSSGGGSSSDDGGSSSSEGGSSSDDGGSSSSDDGGSSSSDGGLMPGECNEQMGVDCGIGQYCDYPDDLCGTGANGTCMASPMFCPLIFDPQCGCDGVTHGNSCEAAGAGTDVDYPGAC